MNDLLRVYLDPDEIGLDGYPYAWHKGDPAIKDYVREQAGHRCVRCGHPYRNGEHGNGEWSPCDEQCTHDGPGRWREVMRGDGSWQYGNIAGGGTDILDYDAEGRRVQRWEQEAQWRILTVHHLNGVKHDCRWWNLAALCQRCHLSVQGRVVMGRIWPWEHSEWFKPYAAGWYAFAYEGREITRDEAVEDLDRLLALERA